MSDISSCPALVRLGDEVRPGRRLSLRFTSDAGPSDFVGLILELDADALVLEDRRGTVRRIPYAAVQLARLVPTVARGRNPRHAPPEMLRTLVSDPWILSAQPSAELLSELNESVRPAFIARLCDLVDDLDSPAQQEAENRASYGGSRVMVNGEWAAAYLAQADDLDALAAWAARRNARNIVLTSTEAPQILRGLGVEEL